MRLIGKYTWQLQSGFTVISLAGVNFPAHSSDRASIQIGLRGFRFAPLMNTLAARSKPSVSEETFFLSLIPQYFLWHRVPTEPIKMQSKALVWAHGPRPQLCDDGAGVTSLHKNDLVCSNSKPPHCFHHKDYFFIFIILQRQAFPLHSSVKAVEAFTQRSPRGCAAIQTTSSSKNVIFNLQISLP